MLPVLNSVATGSDYLGWVDKTSPGCDRSSSRWLSLTPGPTRPSTPDLARVRAADREGARGRGDGVRRVGSGRESRQRRHRKGLSAAVTTRRGIRPTSATSGGSHPRVAHRYDREQVFTAALFLAPALVLAIRPLPDRFGRVHQSHGLERLRPHEGSSSVSATTSGRRRIPSSGTASSSPCSTRRVSAS
jgi:hypothetical protein